MKRKKYLLEETWRAQVVVAFQKADQKRKTLTQAARIKVPKPPRKTLLARERGGTRLKVDSKNKKREKREKKYASSEKSGVKEKKGSGWGGKSAIKKAIGRGGLEQSARTRGEKHEKKEQPSSKRFRRGSQVSGDGKTASTRRGKGLQEKTCRKG